MIGIRREDKNEWERRTPIVPRDAKELIEKEGIEIVVQPSPIRAFTEDEYREAGAKIDENLSGCQVIFGVKEMPLSFFEEGKTYVFFSHTIKGQKHNMPMLKKMMELGCNLIDYEKMTDESGRRVVFFGRFAGIAGMTDTLHALGQRLKVEGIETVFLEVQQAYHYHDVQHLKDEMRRIAKHIETKGFPDELVPLVIGIAGYGNVSRGAQEVLDLLPVIEISAKELLELDQKSVEKNKIYKVVFKEVDTVESKSPDYQFELQDYFQHPEKYRSKFKMYLPHLTVLVNAIYWDSRCPRLVTKADIKELYAEGQPKLRVIGDISCDIEGGIECTIKATDPGNPVFVYDVDTGQAIDGYEGKGPVIMAVDNLPCELPRDSSTEFSRALKPFVPEIAKADYSVEFDKAEFSPTVKRAVILWHGELTPDYKYLQKFVDELG